MFEVRNTELSYTGTKPFAGFYPFLNLKTPDSIAMLQIAGVNGNLYYRGKQSANVIMSGVGWAKIRDSANWGISLYSNDSGTNGMVPLSENISNFSKIEVVFAYFASNQIRNSSIILHNNGKSSVQSSYITLGYDVSTYIEALFYITDKTIGWSRANYYIGTNNSYGQETSLKIVKVLGYK